VNLIGNKISLSVKTVFHSQNIKRRQIDAYLCPAIRKVQLVGFLLEPISGRQQRPERRKWESQWLAGAS